MSTPAKVDTLDKTFSEQVNEAVASATRDGEGKIVMPEGLSEGLQYAVTSEIRRKDTQSTYTKQAQNLKKTQAELDTFKQAYKGTVKVELSPSEETRLDELKYSDPNAWRKEMNMLEEEASNRAEADFNKLRTDSMQKAELAHRTDLLATYNAANPSRQITNKVITNEVPASYSHELEKGTITFEEFLGKVEKFLVGPKKTSIKQTDKVTGQPNMNDVGGGATVIENDGAAETAYEDELY